MFMLNVHNCHFLQISGAMFAVVRSGFSLELGQDAVVNVTPAATIATLKGFVLLVKRPFE